MATKDRRGKPTTSKKGVALPATLSQQLEDIASGAVSLPPRRRGAAARLSGNAASAQLAKEEGQVEEDVAQKRARKAVRHLAPTVRCFIAQKSGPSYQKKIDQNCLFILFTI